LCLGLTQRAAGSVLDVQLRQSWASGGATPSGCDLANARHVNFLCLAENNQLTKYLPICGNCHAFGVARSIEFDQGN
jgi:hypothetical protein